MRHNKALVRKEPRLCCAIVCIIVPNGTGHQYCAFCGSKFVQPSSHESLVSKAPI